MIKRLLALLGLTSVLIVSCGAAPNSMLGFLTLPTDSATTQDSTSLQEIVYEVLQDFKAVGLSTLNADKQDVQFVDSFNYVINTNESTLAVCYMGTSKIRVLRSKFNELTKLMKKQLIAHELGHCLYNLQHTDQTGTLMYPVQTNIPNSTLGSFIYDSMLQDFANRLKGK